MQFTTTWITPASKSAPVEIEKLFPLITDRKTVARDNTNALPKHQHCAPTSHLDAHLRQHVSNSAQVFRELGMRVAEALRRILQSFRQ